MGTVLLSGSLMDSGYITEKTSLLIDDAKEEKSLTSNISTNIIKDPGLRGILKTKKFMVNLTLTKIDIYMN